MRNGMIMHLQKCAEHKVKISITTNDNQDKVANDGVAIVLAPLEKDSCGGYEKLLDIKIRNLDIPDWEILYENRVSKDLCKQIYEKLMNYLSIEEWSILLDKRGLSDDYEKLLDIEIKDLSISDWEILYENRIAQSLYKHIYDKKEDLSIKEWKIILETGKKYLNPNSLGGMIDWVWLSKSEQFLGNKQNIGNCEHCPKKADDTCKEGVNTCKVLLCAQYPHEFRGLADVDEYYEDLTDEKEVEGI